MRIFLAICEQKKKIRIRTHNVSTTFVYKSRHIANPDEYLAMQFVYKRKKNSSGLAISFCLQKKKKFLTKIHKLRVLMSIFVYKRKKNSSGLAISQFPIFLTKIHKLRVLMSIYLAIGRQMKTSTH